MKNATTKAGKIASPPERSVDHRPNPARSIFLTGAITAALVERLVPQILRLQSDSRDPITVYIDSPGGSVFHASVLMRLLRATNQDGDSPCRLITVVTSYAGSAAADFLARGDYAIAYPDSLIHFHGARTRREDFITVEEASGVARDLQASNNSSAIALAKERKRSFFFRFFSQRSNFESYRKESPAFAQADEEICFLGVISNKLSPYGHRVVQRASARTARYQALSDYVMRSRRFRKVFSALDRKRPETHRKLEAAMLTVMIAFELSTNKDKADWGFSAGGLSQLADDFVLLNEYISHFSEIQELCEMWEDFLLNQEEKEELKSLSGKNRQRQAFALLSPRIMPLWLFFAALCHALQEEENPMLALNAFWLGLIDEVIGEDLPTERKVIEMSPGPHSRKKNAS